MAREIRAPPRFGRHRGGKNCRSPAVAPRGRGQDGSEKPVLAIGTHIACHPASFLRESRMRIDGDYSGSTASAGRVGQGVDAGDFAAAMARATESGEPAAAESQKRPPTAEERAATIRQANTALAKELQEYLDKPLAVKLREAVLKEMGLTEEELAAMPPAERQAAEAEISERIRERLLGRKEEGQQQAMDEPLPSGDQPL
ncbi:MAG TPA: hypothetical protein VF096_09960, partial [Azonexus sp.]